jgi:hypothetical protein
VPTLYSCADAGLFVRTLATRVTLLQYVPVHSLIMRFSFFHIFAATSACIVYAPRFRYVTPSGCAVLGPVAVPPVRRCVRSIKIYSNQKKKMNALMLGLGRHAVMRQKTKDMVAERRRRPSEVIGSNRVRSLVKRSARRPVQCSLACWATR